MPPKKPAMTSKTSATKSGSSKPAAKPAAKSSTSKPGASKPAASKTAAKPKTTTTKSEEAAAKPVERNILPAIEITVKQLDAVVVRDIEGRIKDTGRWPMVIDSSGIASTFLRHRDVNVVDTLDQANMEPERLRQALIGSMSHGKPFCIHMLGVDMTTVVREKLDQIRPGLLDAILDKSVLEERVYSELFRDGDMVSNNMKLISPDFLETFKFIILTESPIEPLMDRLCPVQLP